MAPAPLVRMPDRAGKDMPATAAPVNAHRPEYPFGIADIEDVHVAVGQELSGLAIGLLLKKLPDVGEGGLGFASQFVQDRLVQGVLLELADAEGGFSLRIFHLAEEVILEVLSDPGDFHLFAVGSEVVAGEELAGGWKIDDADFLQEGGDGRFHDHQCAREELLHAFLATKLVPDCFDLT